MKIKESDIQKSVIEWLSWHKDIYFTRNNSFAGSFTRRDGSKGWIKNCKAGSPDIIVCYKGKYIGLEIKCIGGKQSELQKQAECDIIRSGGRYYIIRDLKDIEKLFKQCHKKKYHKIV